MIPYNVLRLAVWYLMDRYTSEDVARETMDAIRENFPLYTEEQRERLVLLISSHVVDLRMAGREYLLDEWVELMIELTPGEDRI